MKRYIFLISIVAVIAAILILINSMEIAASFVHSSKREKSNICVLVESGHGKIINNVYQTSGKQSPEWPDGLKIYEGYSNGMLAYELVSLLQEQDIDAFVLNSDLYDYSNLERAERVNKYFGLDSRIIFLSLHHNAQPTDNADYTDKDGLKGFLKGGASGIEIYTSKGQTKSDAIAGFIYFELLNEFHEIKIRTDWTDGDADKEANFTVLIKTDCPAVLIEFLFMTTYEDCVKIADKNIRQRYVAALARAFKNYNNFLNLKS
jgi:N-acetylmuramoyl-L-alanine amidase